MPRLRPTSYKRLVKVFEADGFACVRIEGGHMVFTKRAVSRPVVIPKYASVPVFIIKNNLRTAGISRERYFELPGEQPYAPQDSESPTTRRGTAYDMRQLQFALKYISNLVGVDETVPDSSKGDPSASPAVRIAPAGDLHFRS